MPLDERGGPAEGGVPFLEDRREGVAAPQW